MKKLDAAVPSDVPASTSSRRVRLQALLFTGAALGTTLLTLSAIAGDIIKIPRGYGE
jgi:hypothetical protein